MKIHTEEVLKQLASKRTLVLMKIREFELAEGRGILFDELVENSGISRPAVSKSLDSLDDMCLIVQAGAEMVLLDGMWCKLITTDERSRGWIDNTIEKIKNDLDEVQP